MNEIYKKQGFVFQRVSNKDLQKQGVDIIQNTENGINYIDEKYNVAREAQFVHHIDCFYVDDYIDSFIAKCAEILTENEI